MRISFYVHTRALSLSSNRLYVQGYIWSEIITKVIITLNFFGLRIQKNKSVTRCIWYSVSKLVRGKRNRLNVDSKCHLARRTNTPIHPARLHCLKIWYERVELVFMIFTSHLKPPTAYPGILSTSPLWLHLLFCFLELLVRSGKESRQASHIPCILQLAWDWSHDQSSQSSVFLCIPVVVRHTHH